MALHSRLTTRQCIVVMYQWCVATWETAVSQHCVWGSSLGCCLLGLESWTIIKRREQNDGFKHFYDLQVVSTSQCTVYNKRGEIAIWVVCVLLTPHRLTGGCEGIQFPSSIVLAMLFGSHAKNSWGYKGTSWVEMVILIPHLSVHLWSCNCGLDAVSV